MEYYNWNYLDQHIMGYDDFDMLSDVSVGDIRVSYGVYLCSVALLRVCGGVGTQCVVIAELGVGRGQKTYVL